MRRAQQSSLFVPVSFMSAAQLRIAAFSLFLFIFSAMFPSLARSQAVAPLTLERRYQDGEAVAYKMQATNEGHVRILSATLDNPVEVLQRDCTDRALASCGDPIRYRIRR